MAYEISLPKDTTDYESKENKYTVVTVNLPLEKAI